MVPTPNKPFFSKGAGAGVGVDAFLSPEVLTPNNPPVGALTPGPKREPEGIAGV